MMLYPAMNELLAQVPSRYKLVNVVAARARQIANEAEYTEEMLEDKPVSIAIREIAEGKVPDLTAPEREVTDMEAAFLQAEDAAAQEPEDAESPAEDHPEPAELL